MRGTGLSLDTLRVIVTVYGAGTVTGAAAELGMAQPSVSGQIAAAEERLGYRLFERTARGMRPTERAVEFVSRVAGPLESLLRVAREAEAVGVEPDRAVFLSGPAEFLSEMVLPRLTGYGAGRLVVCFGLAEDLLDRLLDGAVDVVVSSVQPRRRGVAFEPVYDEEFVLVAHPRWREQAAGDIDAVPVLTYADDLPIVRRYWRSIFNRRPTGLSVAAVAPDLRVLARLAAHGVGMTVLPRYLADPGLAAGSLVLLDQPQVPPLNTLYLATRRGAVTDPAVTALRHAVAAAVEAGSGPAGDASFG
ncbi:LysR family transcriptional regulator [Phytoactinopolyspora endophytica]|uniref:LysR family transcriptional regulator n=1 Tax=Phytoactinopolyspora endophytica TaxID=1642495 RepID=UPI00101DF31F|nr:LysR family transcriptional regulator [Phytoactinopolyspora endophytica]